MTRVIEDCRLKTEDSRIDDCRLPIGRVDRGVHSPIDNRQSPIRESSICSLQSSVQAAALLLALTRAAVRAAAAHFRRRRRRCRRRSGNRRLESRAAVRPAARGAWWEVFGDPQLNALEATIDVSSDTLRGARRGSSRRARRSASTGRSRYPQVGTTPQITTGTESGNRTDATEHERVSDFLLPVDVSYEADVWGRVRLGIAAARATAQASAADLEAVRLSLHAELALDYFELRGLDAERVILDNSVAAFERALELTQNRFPGGIASQADVALAETQLETTRAQAVDLGARRAPLEHAIAVLTGKPPSALQMPSSPLASPPPVIPMGLPSDLLERRPDIAAAERRIAAANADVGIAQAAFFPRLLLNASAGFESRSLASWLSGLSNFWSAGPAARDDARSTAAAGAPCPRRRARDTTRRSRSTRKRSCDRCRRSRTAWPRCACCARKRTIQAAAVEAAERSLTLATNRYRGGVTSYLEVIAAQSAALDNQRDRRLDPVAPARRQRAPDQGARRRLDGGVASRDRVRYAALSMNIRPLFVARRRCSRAVAGCTPPPGAVSGADRSLARRKGSVHARVAGVAGPRGSAGGVRSPPYFPVDPAYRVPAMLEPRAAGPVIEMPTSTGQRRKMRRVGTLAFTLKGQPLSLGAFVEADQKDMRRLFVPFGDLTNGPETYQGGRYLDLERTASGVYELDFNRAYHPFCLFNSTYDCPYPPPESRLKVPIRVGERLAAPKR